MKRRRINARQVGVIGSRPNRQLCTTPSLYTIAVGYRSMELILVRSLGVILGHPFERDSDVTVSRVGKRWWPRLKVRYEDDIVRLNLMRDRLSIQNKRCTRI